MTDRDQKAIEAARDRIISAARELADLNEAPTRSACSHGAFMDTFFARVQNLGQGLSSLYSALRNYDGLVELAKESDQ